MASRLKKKAMYKATKKKRFFHALRKYIHNILTFVINIGILVFAYILFYALIFEPVFISKMYGASDTREFMYLAAAGFVIGISYLIRYFINFSEEQQWQRNLRLLRDVNFNLDRYSTLKGLGIDHINKRKKKVRRSASESKKTND